IAMFAASCIITFANGEIGKVNLLWGMGNEALYRLGESNPFAVRFLNEWYRLVTAMFLHLGVLHIGMNMMVLLDVGPVVEEVYGSPRYFFFYTVCGICGSLMSSVFGASPAIGASGAILGLIGVLIAITYPRSGAQIQQLRDRLIS